jgi:carbon monoxide dehydrogenase subunit G
VWEALTDIARVAGCLPGAELERSQEDGASTVRLGPAIASYRGSLSVESVEQATRTQTITASGRDTRAQGSARATIVSSVSPHGDQTKVSVATDLTITGSLARFGRGGMIADVASRLLDQFAKCLQQQLLGPDA